MMEEKEDKCSFSLVNWNFIYGTDGNPTGTTTTTTTIYKLILLLLFLQLFLQIFFIPSYQFLIIIEYLLARNMY